VKRSRGLLLGILVYVALDLSLPAMPGAFVFEPEDSVESIDVARGRHAAKVVVLPTPPRNSFLPSPSRIDFRPRRPPRREVALRERPLVNRLPRATCAPPRSSEDPH
jgi:hypothetical protein